MAVALLFVSGIALVVAQACGGQGAWAWVRVIAEITTIFSLTTLVIAMACGVTRMVLHRFWTRRVRKFRSRF